MQAYPHTGLTAGRTASAGYSYFITTVTANREPLFCEPRAAQIVLDVLHWLHNEQRCSLWAAVVMPDHIHVVTTLIKSIDHVMHTLKSFSAHQINRTMQHYGPVWQAGYFDHGLRDEEQLRNAIRYCIDNPVRAGLVSDPRHYRFTFCRYGITATLDSY